MSYKHLIAPLASLLLIISCKESNNRKTVSDYPKIIDSLSLQDFYDNTKWHLYLLYCDRIPKLYKGPALFSKPLGTCELRFDSISIFKKDSIAFYFTFYYNELTPINCGTFPNLEDDLASGLIKFNGFVKSNSNGKIKYVGSDTTICYVYGGCTSFPTLCAFDSKRNIDTTSNRGLNPLQPDVIKFIQENKKRLDPWFYREAVKRGVLKE